VSKRSDGGAPDPDAPEEQQAGKAKAKAEAEAEAEAEAAPAEEPPRRPSQLDLGAPLSYPDDGTISRVVRRIDGWIGRGEQVVLVALLATVVLTAAGHVLLDRFADYPLPFKDDVIRGGTFAIALLGAAFASHQARHLSMDLVSRRLSPRARLFLKVILALFTIAIVLILVRSGFRLIDKERSLKSEHLISSVALAHLIPIGGGLIIVHTILHAIIDLDYIARRKTPPERMRSAH
jgi:TRAP-type C4-dicarboxylate transport system permease small subunit